jgi:hypothetical protein
MACLLVVGFVGIASAADVESGKRSYVKPGKNAREHVITVKPRARGARIYLPIGPTQVYCDYPYYYSRGHYPTHIGGYVYYPYNYRSYC